MCTFLTSLIHPRCGMNSASQNRGREGINHPRHSYAVSTVVPSVSGATLWPSRALGQLLCFVPCPLNLDNGGS